MAQTPSIADIIRAILDAAKTYKPRANEIIPTTGVQMKVDAQGFTADEFKAGLSAMIEKGWAELRRGGLFFVLTEAGYAEM